MPSLSYKKDEHLKHRKLIEAVFAKGDSKVFYPVCLYWIRLDNQINNHPILFGANVPKKRFKRAVDRNRIKRQIREAYRTQKPLWIADLPSEQIGIMAIYVANDFPDYKNVKKSILRGIRHILQNVPPKS